MQRSNRTPASPQAELAVYDGQDRVGAIRRRDGLFIAVDASGRKLGAFTTLRNAMRAIPRRVSESAISVALSGTNRRAS